jgi:hypothetical protein
LSESLPLSNGQLLSTLAQAAATFVAIVAGFYTTKIITISTDKNRLEYQKNQNKLEIEHRKNTANSLKIQIDKRQEEKDNDLIDFFMENMASTRIRYKMPLNNPDDLIKIWKKYWDTESEPSEAIAKKLKDKYSSLVVELRAKAEEALRKPKEGYTEVKAIPFLRDSTSRIIESDYEREETRKFDKMKSDYDYELNEIKRLESQSQLADRELSSITYPKYIVSGFCCFAYFAFSGVIMPLTSKWWNFYVKEYLHVDPDLFYITLFLTGLIVTLAYIGIETFSVIDIKKRIFPKKQNEQK